MAGGDHGDVAFQFGAAVLLEISDGRTMDFEVSLVELICRKDTAKLIEATILPISHSQEPRDPCKGKREGAHTRNKC